METSPQSNFRVFFITPKRNPVSISSHSPFSYYPSPKKPLTYFLSLKDLPILDLSYIIKYWSFVTGFFH